MNTKLLIASAIAAAVAIPAATVTTSHSALAAGTSEKCYGIAAKGLNDCKTASHSCAGSATMGRDPASWVFVPTGTCKKIDGGKLMPM